MDARQRMGGMKMAEAKYRLKLKSGWRGKSDSTDPECEEKEYKAGEELDVDVKTYQALVFQYEKATPVSVAEIEAKAIEAAKPKGSQRTRASKSKK